MREINVLGVGFLTSLGITAEDILRAFTTSSDRLSAPKIPFTSFLPPAKKRRTDRFSDMTVYVGVSALMDARQEADERLGTVFTTGYGPLTGNIAFARKVALGDPDICSPTAFSGTVSNACVGHLCNHLGCKGPSTMLTASNALGYAQMLLSSRKTNRILCGAVEEYEENLFASLQKDHPLPCGYSEGAAALLLSDDLTPKGYCRIVSFAEGYIGGYPPFENVEKDFALRQMKAILASEPAFATAEAVLSAANGCPFDKIERAALASLGDIPVIDDVKKRFGETLGGSFTLSVAVGALLLAKGALPCGKAPLSSLLVTGYDVSGNYTAVLLKK